MNERIHIRSHFKFRRLEQVTAAALELSVVNQSIAKTCRKLDGLHLELKKRELKHFDERAR